MGIEYVEGDSKLHRLSALVKIFIFVYLIIIVVMVNDPLYLMLHSLVVMVIALRSGIPWGKIKGLLKALTLFIVMMFILNMLTWKPTKDEIIIFYLIPTLNMFPQTIEGLAFNIAMIWKSVLLILSLRVITLVTPVDDIIEALLKLKVPYIIAMPFGMGLQMVPMMFNLVVTLMEAQQSRGWEFAYKNPFKKLRAYMAIILPLVIIGRNAGEQVAVALDVRGFGANPRQRTKRKKGKVLTRLDYAVACLLVILVIIVCLFGNYGTGALTHTGTARLIKTIFRIS